MITLRLFFIKNMFLADSIFLAFRVFQEETVSLCSGHVTLLFCHSCEHWFHPWNLYNLNWSVYICL